MSNIYKKIDYKTAINFLISRHYSGRKPQIKYAFGCFENDKLIAVLTVGKPASNSLCKGVCGEQYSTKVYELNRLCVDGILEKPLSNFVSYCLKELKKENIILISYADTDMNHVGTIYKATNWIYTGQTKQRTDKFTEGNKHSRHYDKEAKEQFRKIRSSKHRYIYFCCSKKETKKLKSKLKYPVKEYPKGKSHRYILGDFQKPKIIKIENCNTK